MAFIKTIKNREGKVHVYLVEGYRIGDKVKQRTLKKYGILEQMQKEEPDILNRLKKEAKEATNQNKDTLDVSYDLSSPIDAPDKSYGWKILDDIFKSLGISKLLRKYQDKRSNTKIEGILKLLVFQRILSPNSKISTYKSQSDLFGNWNITLNDIYRSLDKFDELKDEIQLHLHKKITKITNRTGALVFYDVTNYYFESDVIDTQIIDEQARVIEEGLRRRGPSKENRPNPIIQLGLFMDTNGIPISYKLFKGNEVDPTTYIPAVIEVKEKFAIERIIVVADKAMNSSKNIEKMLEIQDGYLFSQKHRGKRGAPKEIQKQILDTNGWLFNEEMTFAKKTFERERKIKTEKKEKVVKEKVLLTWNKKYAIREKIRRNSALDYASKLTNAQLFQQTAKKGGKKYLKLSYKDKETGEIKPFSPIIEIDKELAEYEEQFDGINVIVTSELNMSDEEMLKAYSQLSMIEDCFKVTKTELETRPVYVRKESHIQGHFFTCFVALIHIRLLEHLTKRKMSPKRMIRAMNSAKASPLKNDYYKLTQNDDMTELLKMLNISWEKGIVKYEQLNKFAKGWCTTK